MNHLADRYAFDRLVLAGGEEAMAELRGLLPKRLRSRIVGQLPMSANAGEQEVLQATLQLEQKAEREQEPQIVSELIADAAKGGQAVVGLESVLDELHRKRLWRLVYAEGTHPPGWKCLNCSSLFARDAERCDYCNREVASAGDLIEQLVTRVIAEGGEAEQVRGIAADLLRDQGGIGGYLRY